MSFQMTHANHRNIQSIGQCLRIIDPYEKSAGETWSLGNGNSGEIRP